MASMTISPVSRPGPSSLLAGIEHRCLTIPKPWGHEVVWALSELYCGKLLCVNAGQALSLQLHRRKDETIYLQEGRLELTVAAGRDGELVTEVVEPGSAFRIRAGTVHRMKALEDSVVIEVSTPELEDVVRLEDAYGRAS
jgi:quercetin dioxygenase-like cupin family protein